jgi:hypothetical protein
MSIRKRFNEILGIEDGIIDERDRFVQRVNQAIFHRIDTLVPLSFKYDELFEALSFEMGVDAHSLPRRRGRYLTPPPPELVILTGNDFTKTLELLCVLYARIQIQGDSDEGRAWLSKGIEGILSRCTRDIGVKWKDGLFYPSGAGELDEALIEQTFTWLKDYPNERQDYRIALQNYSQGGSLADVIKNCYSALEGVAKNVLGNRKNLDNNKDELLRKMSLSDGWKSLLAVYIRYAHDYRHASPERHDMTRQEAEAYLYMTGLIIRLVIESE